MKRTITLCKVFLFIWGTTFAQIDSNLCDRRVEKIADKLSSVIEIEQETLNSIELNISPCLTDTPNSLYLKGLIEMLQNTEVDYSMAFDLFEQASDLGHPKATTYLAYFYKNGWSVDQNFHMAQTYLELAVEMEDPTAIYALGYFYFKGLTGDNQNYQNAINLFSQSNNPMARHWLAINHLFGLGCDQNIELGTDLLSSNDVSNSQILLETLNSEGYNLGDLKELRFTVNTDEQLNNINEILDIELYGGLYELEWSGQKVISEHAIQIHLDSENNSLTLTEGDLSLSSSFQITGNKIIPGHLNLSFPALIQDNLLCENYTYEVKEIEFFKDLEQNQFIAKIHTWISELNEPGLPVYCNFMSQELLDSKIQSSISLHPNSFQTSFETTFTLEKPSVVGLEVYDLNGIKKLEIPSSNFSTGEGAIHVNAPQLQTGVYLSVLIVDGSTFSNQIIKTN